MRFLNNKHRAKGLKAEEEACGFLKTLGFEMVERNFFSQFGEIDIIALKKGVLHFIEVKSGENFDPIYAITPNKLKKMIKTIRCYFSQKDPHSDFCIDALIVKNGNFELLENITF
ncbi:YraN family protein [Helicobacter pylori]|uniref:YraN family protein n=1 Tax=Helicobacter pylori TaxID=210 RepID=UPI000D3AFCD3|nr:YraN family protein [Helicobacter pylori]PUD01445.1 YraN family protein [Helicobacter pylori]